MIIILESVCSREPVPVIAKFHDVLEERLKTELTYTKYKHVFQELGYVDEMLLKGGG